MQLWLQTDFDSQFKMKNIIMSTMLFLYPICSNSLMRILKLFASLHKIERLLEYRLKLDTRICHLTKMLFRSHVIHSPQLQQKLTIPLQHNVIWECVREVEKIFPNNCYYSRKNNSDHHYIPKTYQNLFCAFFLDWIHSFPHNSLPSNLVILQPLSNTSTPVTCFISICLTNCRPQPGTVF